MRVTRSDELRLRVISGPNTPTGPMHKVQTASVISAASRRVNFERWGDAWLMTAIVHPALTSSLGDAMA